MCPPISHMSCAEDDGLRTLFVVIFRDDYRRFSMFLSYDRSWPRAVEILIALDEHHLGISLFPHIIRVLVPSWAES